jgi:Zn-dependent protease
MQRGAFPLFRFGGIQVYLHFSWLIVAWFEISLGKNRYGSPGWAAAEYVGLFAIVLLHEFGHAFACRSTGGRADRIVLWPLGGLAFVDPPMRPGAVLWSIAAGPLVNVVLFPILFVAATATASYRLIGVDPNLHHLSVSLCFINLTLLIFNLLPFYPLDGGQIVRALLWFKVGPVRSLMIAGVIGIFGAALVGLFAYRIRSIWVGIIAFFLFSQAKGAIERTKAMRLQVDEAATPSPSPTQQASPKI